MPAWTDRALLCLLLAAPAGLFLGCSEGTGAEDVGIVCDPGEGQMCTCASGLGSVAWCRIDGTGFLPCECEAGDEGFGGETAGDGDGDGDGDTGDGDGDGDTGDGDGETGDGDTGDGDADTGDGDGDGDPILDQACYPGPNDDYSVCFPIVVPAPLPAGYDYPAPYQGNPNYRAPVRYLDLDAIDQSAQVAANFTLDEFAQSWKGRYAVLQPHAVAYVQDLRDVVGPISVNSGYRPPAYNAMVGGAGSSRHIYGDGFDLDPIEVPLATLEAACSNNAGFLVEYESHVHCDWRNVDVDVGFFGLPNGDAPNELPLLAASLEQDPHTGHWSAPASGFDEGEPVRRWTAFAADDRVLTQARGRTFEAPPETAYVEVLVGARMRLVGEPLSRRE
ncbi:Dipeptide-binding ABC transporter, periplasmic substrate-binding component [Enhygromyxa salina]|uniref:Dipeptide-binding ABC transporter, periplasmic substrate-binding component n=1 Tax=Enhygromyxa salina TaxID=215803 RepID=A0A0C1Z4K4_9BACT|nr:D-Ala-D-Ala carboxypeptidase family metallohydrolase [Enhygromyxa salina]KIG12599.1 Dipeptide-binding ABC transporter, periplasmic substrate-binding component [Enhygromyxa salina]